MSQLYTDNYLDEIEVVEQEKYDAGVVAKKKLKKAQNNCDHLYEAKSRVMGDIYGLEKEEVYYRCVTCKKKRVLKPMYTAKDKVISYTLAGVVVAAIISCIYVRFWY